MSGICVTIDIANLCSLFKDRNDVVTYKCVVLVAVGERHESLQKRLLRNEVAGCLSGITHRYRHSKSQRWHKGVPVSGGLHASNSCSTGNPWSKRVDSKSP